ncbi:MAG TPA: glycosyltransferase, partial [Chloroflexota bacterium]|nr:glycosyltransferase [Chloroflexota bacterium]
MRLVLVAPFAAAPKATTSARVFPLARALAARGHSVTVLVPPYDNPAEGGQAFRLGDARVEALAVEPGLPEESPRQAIAQPRLALRLVRRAAALQPHAVHVFKPKAVSGLAQMLLWYGRRFHSFPGRSLALLHPFPSRSLRSLDWGGGPEARPGRGPRVAPVVPLRSALRSATGPRPGPALVLDTDDWEGFGGWNEYEAYPWWQKQLCDWQERWGLTHAGAVT